MSDTWQKDRSIDKNCMELKAIRLNTLVTILSIFAFVGGGAVFLWKAASMNASLIAEVQALRTDVDAIKAEGSVALRLFKRESEIDSKAIHAEIDSLKDAFRLVQTFQINFAKLDGSLETIRAEVRSVETQVSGVKKSLDDHNRSTQEMMKGQL